MCTRVCLASDSVTCSSRCWVKLTWHLSAFSPGTCCWAETVVTWRRLTGRRRNCIVNSMPWRLSTVSSNRFSPVLSVCASTYVCLRYRYVHPLCGQVSMDAGAGIIVSACAICGRDRHHWSSLVYQFSTQFFL